MKYSKYQSELRLFVLRPSAHPLELGLPKPAWYHSTAFALVLEDCSRTCINGVGLAPTSICKCGALDQTASHSGMPVTSYPQTIQEIANPELRD